MKKLNLLFLFMLFWHIGFSQQSVDFTIRYNLNSSPNRYEVYVKSNFTQANTVMFQSQITLVLPSSVSNGNWPITSHVGGSWALTSSVFGPVAQPQSDFRAVSGQATINFVANQEILLFSFTLTEGCVAGVRLFNNPTDPNSSAPGMGGGDFMNFFPNSNIVDLYGTNYDNAGTTCTPPSQDIDLTIRYSAVNSRYEVYARPTFTQTNFTWGPSQITVVTPNMVPDVQLTSTNYAAGAWGDNSTIYTPSAQPQNDFHGFESSGALVNLVANQEVLLFAFTLPTGCVPGVRLFNNGVDPNSSAPGMGGGDFWNTIDNGNITDVYNINYDNAGTVCGSQQMNLTIRYSTSNSRYEVYGLPNFTLNNFTWGPSQISVVVPSSVTNAAFLNVTPYNGGGWNDNSLIYAPAAQPQSDFHGVGSLGALTNLVANQEILLFSVTLPEGCVPGVRLFNNGVDPNSSAPGMGFGDFGNSIDNGNITEIYYTNYNNTGTTCPVVQEIDLTISYSVSNSRYEVYGRPNFTQSNFLWGPSQISVVVPNSVANSAIPNIIPNAGGGWNDNSQIYAPAAQPQSDFHGFGTTGAYTSLVANQEKLLFSFTLPEGCVTGVRLFNNGVDPDSYQPGMFFSDFWNTIDNGNITDVYDENYNNAGTVCPIPQEVDLTMRYNKIVGRYEVFGRPNFTESNFVWGPSTISVLIPKAAPNSALTIQSHSGGGWGDIAQAYQPSGYPNQDFHAISGGSGTSNFSQFQETLLFSFTLTDGCSDLSRIFNNGSDPNSSAPGMGGADFSNAILNSSVTDIYDENYNNLGVNCQHIDLTVKYVLGNERYEVYGRPDFTNPNFTWGPSQITVVTPNSVTDGPLNIMNHAAGAWGDNSIIYAPAAQAYSDFHGVETGGALTNLVNNQEKLLFSFVLPEGCVPGVRLFVNGVDPDSGQPGMGGGDFWNTIDNGNVTDIYRVNYNNSGTTCPTTLAQHYFETGWDGWVDGGANCQRLLTTNSAEGQYSIEIKSKSSTSLMTSSNINLVGYGTVKIEFSYKAESMETGEDFWLQYWNGSQWFTIQTYVAGTDFVNGNFYTVSRTFTLLNYAFSSTSKFRFRCDASDATDKVFIDRVIIKANNNIYGMIAQPTGGKPSELHSKNADEGQEIIELTVYPNPAQEILNISLPTLDENAEYRILNLSGQLMLSGILGSSTLDIESLNNGMYFIEINNNGETYKTRFVKTN